MKTCKKLKSISMIMALAGAQTMVGSLVERSFGESVIQQFINAVQGGKKKELKKLYFKHADLLNYQDDFDRWSALHHAVFSQQKESIALLLRLKANVAVQTSRGNTPLHFAAQTAHKESVKLLLEEGAPLNIKNTAGKIPWDFAKEVGEKVIMELLEPPLTAPTSSSTKAVLNYTNGKKRKSPPSQENVLFKERTEYRGAFKVVQGKAPRIDSIQELPKTTLLFSPKKGSALQGKGQNGITSLHVAAQYGHTSILEMLLKGGMNKDVVDRNGDTPLHKAVLFNREAIVSMLLKAGAKTEVVNKDGFTPLHLAAQNGWLAITMILLMADAKTEAVDKYGATALHWAVLRDHECVMNVLLMAGASLDSKDKSGITPLQLNLQKALQRLLVEESQ